MSDEVVEFLENKIKISNNDIQKELDLVTLSLYRSGNIEASIVDGELFLKITKKGEREYLEQVSTGFSPAEA